MNMNVSPWLIGVLLLGACAPRSKPATNPETASNGSEKPRRFPAPAREVMIGEMCERLAHGRPAVTPLITRRRSWESEEGALARSIDEREARQFSVYGWNGVRSGSFSVVGGATHDQRRVAVGSYAGAAPCNLASKGRTGPETADDPECVLATKRCGLALAVLEPSGGFTARPFEEEPDRFDFSTSGACLKDGRLYVDIDDDQAVESFALADFVGEAEPLADEVYSAQSRKRPCRPRFGRRLVQPGGLFGNASFELLGVVDIDGDGRYELIVVLAEGEKRTWAVYSAAATTSRFERVARAFTGGRSYQP